MNLVPEHFEENDIYYLSEQRDKVLFLQRWFNVLNNKDGCVGFDGSVSEYSPGADPDWGRNQGRKDRIKESLLFSLLNLLLLLFPSLLRVCACFLFFLTISPHFLHSLWDAYVLLLEGKNDTLLCMQCGVTHLEDARQTSKMSWITSHCILPGSHILPTSRV